MKKLLVIILLSATCLCANAYSTYYIPETGSPTYRFNIYSPGETVKIEGEDKTSAFEIPQAYIYPILLAAEDWEEKIGLNSSPVTPALYTYIADDEYNASAYSQYVTVSGLPYKISRTNAILHGLTITTPQEELDENDGDGAVEVGYGISEQHPGWQPYTGKHALYHGELPDLYPVMKHELMHSLGVASGADQYFYDPSDPTSDKSYYFSEDPTDPITIYDSHLRIYKGDDDPLSDPSQEFMPQPGQKIGEGAGEFDVDNYSPYFIGQNSIKVLGDNDDYNTARQAIIDNGGLTNYSDAYYDEDDPEDDNYPEVYGLPIHPYDGFDVLKEYDLSHLEFRNSYMSHQDFRNWLTPMEAELALMNDIGYNVQLRKYFGKSYYLNNQTKIYSRGFSEWDEANNSYTGTPSTINQAVGIHIYGNNNDITQTANNIETMGEGSIGVRVDGSDNTYTLSNSNIHANGKENIGIAATWGHDHEINVEAGTEVTAKGEDGIAVSFDFGSNLFGTADSNIKGSYINYLSGNDSPPDPVNQGALVKEFNVEGTLEGSKAAIYISDNAYVDDINVKDGAKINGDIISDWNSVCTLDKARVLKKDGSSWRPTDTDDPNDMYHTYLNFEATTNGAEVNGNIIGAQKYYNTLKIYNDTNSKLNFNGKTIDVNSIENFGEINIKNDTSIKTSEDTIIGNGDINVLSGASLKLSSDITAVENSLNFNNASFNLSDNSTNSVKLAAMKLTGTNSMNVDVDINTLTSDRITFDNQSDLIVNPGASLNISKVNLMNFDNNTTKEKFYIPFVSSADNNQNLLGAVNLTDNKKILTPIFKYNLGYTQDETQGGFLLSRGAARSYNSYNPAVTVAPVAAQIGGYLSQLNSYDEAFRNLDMKMLMTREERQALKMANTYASTVTPTVYSPIYLPEKDKGMWFRPYASFEKIDLRNGPKVESIGYGSYFGGDSPMYSTKNGWDYQYSVYAGYNGSHQNYSGNSIYQNGGTLGATAIWYKNNFFTALTANVGAGVADASTMYGSEDFPMLMSGVASKTGYNWELAKGKFIIQPSYLMSYTFVNTFDYRNAAGLRIKSDPLNAINITPGLKFIGNLKNGWQPYAGIQMVWNIMDRTDFRANNVSLPNMSVKPYVQYGVGVQKRWGDRFTGFFQAMIRNGGRNGVALSLGFRWALGK